MPHPILAAARAWRRAMLSHNRRLTRSSLRRYYRVLRRLKDITGDDFIERFGMDRHVAFQHFRSLHRRYQPKRRYW